MVLVPTGCIEISCIAAIRAITRAADVSKRAAPRRGVNRISFGFQSAPTTTDNGPARWLSRWKFRALNDRFPIRTTYTNGWTAGTRGTVTRTSRVIVRGTPRLFRIDTMCSALTGRYNKIIPFPILVLIPNSVHAHLPTIFLRRVILCRYRIIGNSFGKRGRDY